MPLNQFTVSLWGDEGFSAILSMKSIPDLVKTIITDTSPPLYNITEHLWFQAFGTSEVAIRGLSFVYYIIAAFFTFLIGSYLFNKKTGLVAAALAFLNPFFFIYAFEGRMYSILAAGMVASMYFFIKRKWVGYVIATLAAMYSHHFAIFGLFLQGLWFIYEFLFGDRKAAIGMFKSFVAIMVFYLPWMLPLFNQVKMVGAGFWLATPTLENLAGLMLDYLGKGIPHMLAIPALVFTVVAILIRHWDKDAKSSIFLASWFVVPIVTTWIVSQVFQSIFFNRYLIHSIPAAMLLVASRPREFSKVVISAVLVSYAIISLFYFTHPTKDPFRDLADYVKQTRRGDDFVINGDAGRHKLWETKYYGIPAPIYVPSGEELPFFVGTALMEEADIIDELPKPRRNNPFRIGVVNATDSQDPEIPGYSEQEAKEFGNLRFTWYSLQ